MTRIERWESRAEVPLMLLAVAFLVAYAWPVVDPGLDRDVEHYFSLVSWTVWAAFAVDFGVRLALVDDRRRYALKHWYDVVLIVVPLLRPLRLLRLVALIRILNRSAAGSLLGRASTYAVGSAVLAVGLGAVAVLDAEQDAPGARITTIGDALWWAAVTVTTVGYGDYYPVTTPGRLIAVVLMVVGIGLVGVVTASVAAWLVRAVEDEEEDEEQDQREAAQRQRERSAGGEGSGGATPTA